MPQSATVNRQILLASRPVGAPVDTNFRMVESEVPKPGPGQMLLRNLWMSLDPYMRGRMSDAKSYADPVPVGGVMTAGTVARVVESNLDGYQSGDLVMAYTGGWQDYTLSDGSMIFKQDPGMPRPSQAVGVLGMPGFTGYMGLMDIGQPRAGETVVVAAATGPVGAVVGQVAKLQGCRVVGIAGGAEKCSYAQSELGFDVCLDHKRDDLPAQLARACPDGIDVYFENVGGKVFDAVMPLLNAHARVPVCGLISQYNATSLPDGPDRLPLLMRLLLSQRVRMQGFIIFDNYGPRYPEFLEVMTPWVNEGKVTVKEDVVEGLENAPQAFMGLLEGRNFGKLVVHIAD
ncbi:NADP-dependent oxidoreductase [Halopseudomonas nanhaiensis]|uniref:NADP-dependent oxidoreductase n=1 Tax=Halopseudomonas nanhaiensis TaxID=2830842 RepID=UPI001CC08C00|nr:NADP-dependent oxidoreductase [Halopseudomonas nanhaiensis]UAW97309.1 NADP-dependent oxidoreductase [Halopseudomonas nanhaiensis]